MSHSRFRGVRVRLRGILAALCGTLGLAAILIAGFIAYGSHALFDSGPFADRVAQSLDDPRVSSFVAGRLTDQLLAEKRDLIALRPIILAVSEAVVSSVPARAVIRRAARNSHQVAMSEGTRDVLLSVDDMGVILRSALATQPELAEKIPKDASAVVARLGEAPVLGNAAVLVRLGHRLRSAGLAVFFVGILLVFGSVAIARQRRLALLANGIALAGVAVMLLIIARFGSLALAGLTEDAALGGALAGLWDSFAGGLIPRALAIGLAGIIFAAASASLFERVQLDSMIRSAALWFARAQPRPGAALTRAILLILIGGLAVLSPQFVVSLLAILCGAVVLFVGLEELFRLVLPALPVEIGELRTETGKPGGRAMGFAAAALVAIILAVAGGVVLFGRSEAAATTTLRLIDRCNGYTELCDRRLDRVVLPGTHNSMAAAEIPDWMFPNQERRIPAQLQDGIRAFMIDVHAGIPVAGRIKTDVDDEGAARVQYEAALGREGVDAALRIRNRLVGEEEGERGLYLCHGFCELGAEPLVPVLAEMREFLVANPHEVVILIFEDPGADAQQMDSAFRASGLIDFVYKGPVTPPWPTLRELIANDGRVLVLSENAWPGVPWYHPAFEVEQETPYSFKGPSEFSCKPNRGGTAGSLFVINHWIDTAPAPLPSNAEQVNAHDALLARAHACQRERGMLPNVIAVDFYRTGDVVGVARTLNRVADGAAVSGS